MLYFFFSKKLNFKSKNPSKIRKNMSTFKKFKEFNKINEYKYMYKNVMEELDKKFWKDFDYHRQKMSSVFAKIKNIKWIEVDNNEYNKIIRYEPENSFLECSRYCHYTYKKCYPNFDECYECFKYWCGDCSKGTNSMYSSCNGKRCRTFLENNPIIFEIKNTSKRIYIFKNDNTDWLASNKKTLINRAIYGF